MTFTCDSHTFIYHERILHFLALMSLVTSIITLRAPSQSITVQWSRFISPGNIRKPSGNIKKPVVF